MRLPWGKPGQVPVPSGLLKMPGDDVGCGRVRKVQFGSGAPKKSGFKVYRRAPYAGAGGSGGKTVSRLLVSRGTLLHFATPFCQGLYQRIVKFSDRPPRWREHGAALGNASKGKQVKLLKDQKSFCFFFFRKRRILPAQVGGACSANQDAFASLSGQLRKILLP